MRNIHLSMSSVSRADGGSSLASYAYISGKEATDERLKQDFAYSRRAERIKATGNMLPKNAPPEYEKAENWLNDIEKIEDRADARPAKKIVLAFPRKISPAKREEILRRWIEVNLTQQGYPATYAIHEDKAGNNPHAHIIVANRPIKDGKWQQVKTKTEFKVDEFGERVPVLEIDKATGKPIPLLNEEGQQVKDKHGRPVYKQLMKTYKDGRARKQWHRVTVSQNPLDKVETLQGMRVTWAYELNRELDPAHWVDWRSFEDQGLDITPQIHEGYAAREIEKKGGKSWKCQINRDIRANNKALTTAKAKLIGVQMDKADSMAKLGNQLGNLKQMAGTMGVEDVLAAKQAISNSIPGKVAGLAAKQITIGVKAGIAVWNAFESTEEKKMKVREAKEKADAESMMPSRKKKKQKKQEQPPEQGRAGGRVRSNHEQPPEQRGGWGR